MSRLHDEPFKPGTLNKLDILELYTREWLPVFLSQADPWVREIHVFDFFAGPGKDKEGNSGSPIRTLNALRASAAQGLAGWSKVKVVAHFFDKDRKASRNSERRLARMAWLFRAW